MGAPDDELEEGKGKGKDANGRRWVKEAVDWRGDERESERPPPNSGDVDAHEQRRELPASNARVLPVFTRSFK